MSIKGFNVSGVTEKYDYNSLDNLPEEPSGSYEDLTDKPSINGVELSGDVTSSDLGLPTEEVIESIQQDYTALANEVGRASASFTEVTVPVSSTYPLGYRTGYFYTTDGKSSTSGNWFRSISKLTIPDGVEKIRVENRVTATLRIAAFSDEPSFSNNANNESIFLRGAESDAAVTIFAVRPGDFIYLGINYKYADLTSADVPLIYGVTTLQNDVLSIEKGLASVQLEIKTAAQIGALGIITDLIDIAMPESMVWLGENKLLWAADSSKHETNNLSILTFEDGIGSTFTRDTITHSLGHLNSIDFRDGALISANGGADNYNGGSGSSPGNGEIYIINDFLDKFAAHLAAGTTMTLSDAITITCPVSSDEYKADSKFNVVFGESNLDTTRGSLSNPIIYLLTSKMGEAYYNHKIRRILLGTGSNELPLGALVPNTPSGKFNGTYKILKTFSGTSDGTDQVNDCSFVNGRIVACSGENGCRVLFFALNEVDSTFSKYDKRQIRYAADGTALTEFCSGLTATEDNVLIGFSGSGNIAAFGISGYSV